MIFLVVLDVFASCKMSSASVHFLPLSQTDNHGNLSYAARSVASGFSHTAPNAASEVL